MRRAASALALAVACATVAACGGHRPTVEGPPPPAVYRPDPQPSADVAVDVRVPRLLEELAGAGPATAVRVQHDLLRLGADALPALATVLADPAAAPAHRQVAAFVLGEADSEIACGTLRSAWLERPGDDRLAVAVAVALGRCGQTEPLLAMVQSPAGLDVRLKAAIALALGGERAAVEPLDSLRAELPQELGWFGALAAALLGDSDAGTALAASGSLAELPPDVAGFHALAAVRSGVPRDGTVEALRVAAVENPDPIVRQAALETLHGQGDPYARTLLTTALGDPSARVANVAAQMLGTTVGP